MKKYTYKNDSKTIEKNFIKSITNSDILSPIEKDLILKDPSDFEYWKIDLIPADLKTIEKIFNRYF